MQVSDSRRVEPQMVLVAPVLDGWRARWRARWRTIGLSSTSCSSLACTRKVWSSVRCVSYRTGTEVLVLTGFFFFLLSLFCRSFLPVPSRALVGQCSHVTRGVFSTGVPTRPSRLFIHHFVSGSTSWTISRLFLATFSGPRGYIFALSAATRVYRS